MACAARPRRRRGPTPTAGVRTSIVAAVREELGPRLIGHSALRSEALHALAAVPGADRVARGALDVALWDLAGLLLGQPTQLLFGGYATEVPVAHMVSLADPGAMVEEALEAHERFGVTTFKVKVGREPALDVAAVAAVREALPDAELYVDANRGWTVEQALAAVPPLVDLGVRAIEEPIDVRDSEGRRRVAAASPVPLAGDESCTSLEAVAAAREEGAIGQVSVKAARTGFTESRRIAAFCTGSDLAVVVGSQYEGAMGAFASVALATALAATSARPAEVTNFADLGTDLVAEGPQIAGGYATASQAPGLGVVVDEDALRHHRVDG